MRTLSSPSRLPTCSEAKNSFAGQSCLLFPSLPSCPPPPPSKKSCQQLNSSELNLGENNIFLCHRHTMHENGDLCIFLAATGSIILRAFAIALLGHLPTHPTLSASRIRNFFSHLTSSSLLLFHKFAYSTKKSVRAFWTFLFLISQEAAATAGKGL